MIAATTFLGLFPLGARVAYAGGGSPESVAVLRHFCTFLFLLSLLRLTGRQAPNEAMVVSSRRHLVSALGLGSILAIYAWAYVAALRTIPVSLAVLLLYTFPAQVVLVTAIAGIERPGLLRIIAVVSAFGGIALALGAQPSRPDPTGVALGLLAGFGLALITILGARLTGTPAGRVLAVRMALVATLLTAALAVTGPGLALPSTVPAWAGFVFAGMAAALGVSLYLVALPLIGPVQASGLSNLEPVVAIVGAGLFLGETPGAAQMAGIATVVAAIVLLQYADRRRARSFPPPDDNDPVM